MEKTKKTAMTKKLVKKSTSKPKAKPKKETKLKNEPMTLAEELFLEQYKQQLDGKETKEYPKILEDM